MTRTFENLYCLSIPLANWLGYWFQLARSSGYSPPLLLPGATTVINTLLEAKYQKTTVLVTQYWDNNLLKIEIILILNVFINFVLLLLFNNCWISQAFAISSFISLGISGNLALIQVVKYQIEINIFIFLLWTPWNPQMTKPAEIISETRH